MTDLNEEDAFNEVLLSRHLLESKLGVRIRYFAYPYGDLNQKIIQMVKKAGYEGAVAVNDGDCDVESDMFTLKRKMIHLHPFCFFAVHIEGIFENTRFSII